MQVRVTGFPEFVSESCPAAPGEARWDRDKMAAETGLSCVKLLNMFRFLNHTSILFFNIITIYNNRMTI